VNATPTSLDGPLSDAEIETLAVFLHGLPNPDALTFEAVDGFFCALICGPDLVLPSEYLPHIWGDADAHAPFSSEAEADAILSLLMRHWNAIVREFEESEVYLPLMAEDNIDEDGVEGRAWALGFMRGARLRWDGWQAMFGDENEGQLLVIPVLAGEVDPDWPPEPLTPQAREDLLKDLIVGVARAHRRFVRKATPDELQTQPFRRPAPKIGRNQPCPCGSGKKFKQCCWTSASEDAPIH